MFENIKALLGITTPSTDTMIQFTGAADVGKLPEGYFRVYTKSGHETMGWRQGSAFNLDVRAARPAGYELLPCVMLNFPTSEPGVTQLRDGTKVQEIGDQGGNMPGQTPDAVDWDDHGGGIAGKEHARRADINNGLW